MSHLHVVRGFRIPLFHFFPVQYQGVRIKVVRRQAGEQAVVTFRPLSGIVGTQGIDQFLWFLVA
jgi:hypothetical protein